MSQNLLAKHQIAVFYEDPNLLVLSKPPGLLSQGEKTGDINLVDILREYFGRHYVGLIHRLDRNTSGLMVVAKRSKSAERLSEGLKSGELKRGYQAWLHGTLKVGLSSKWEDKILKDEKTNVSKVVRQHPSAKSAILNFKVVKN